MIRYVHLGSQINEDADEFAFFNTVKNRFVEVGGAFTFASVEDLREAAGGEDVSRLEGLIPPVGLLDDTLTTHGLARRLLSGEDKRAVVEQWTPYAILVRVPMLAPGATPIRGEVERGPERVWACEEPWLPFEGNEHNWTPMPGPERILSIGPSSGDVVNVLNSTPRKYTFPDYLDPKLSAPIVIQPNPADIYDPAAAKAILDWRARSGGPLYTKAPDPAALAGALRWRTHLDFEGLDAVAELIEHIGATTFAHEEREGRASMAISWDSDLRRAPGFVLGLGKTLAEAAADLLSKVPPGEILRARRLVDFEGIDSVAKLADAVGALTFTQASHADGVTLLLHTKDREIVGHGATHAEAAADLLSKAPPVA